MAKDAIIVIRGTVDWAKVVGKARPYTGNPKYDKGPLWSVDITPDAKSRKLLKDLGLEEKLREPNEKYEKEHRKETFISLKIQETRADGTKNDPPKIIAANGQDWGEDLIGNGTVADIKVKVKDYGKASEKGMYFQAMRVLELVPYASSGFEPLSEDDEFFAKTPAAKPPVVDDEDDVPFDVGN